MMNPSLHISNTASGELISDYCHGTLALLTVTFQLIQVKVSQRGCHSGK